MTKTKQLLQIMGDGVPVESKELAKVTGWSMEDVTQILGHMKAAGYIETAPQVYTITEQGKARMARKTTAEYERRKAHDKAKAQERAKPSPMARVNSVFSLGAMT